MIKFKFNRLTTKNYQSKLCGKFRLQVVLVGKSESGHLLLFFKADVFEAFAITKLQLPVTLLKNAEGITNIFCNMFQVRLHSISSKS